MCVLQPNGYSLLVAFCCCHLPPPKSQGLARQITQSRLAGQGLRTLSLDNPKHVERYSLQQLAAERTSLAG